ncbi:DUF1223 domain-containing protein [Costertonia aggregata]|uniref:DUF1223 domain-containing protein n=1 Tax=Costertonia aggregata TaxID=343403 RepID=A0A7H9AT56_9FLAO|nr:DUF1223 domain-containing protein [Costertonia aggregata]QLG46661.1 DUF1223 domain-containing protein [Costertonia aggregata]
MLKKIMLAALVFSGLAISGFTKNKISKLGIPETKATGENIYEPIVVLELFTSQGCSSCPSADLLLNKVKNEFDENVFALSYHVDYWNHIGWKDPFSKAEYGKKQSSYNSKIGYRGNYTPEVVVNGKAHFVGSNTSKMYAKINDYSKQKTENTINISNVVNDEKTIGFDYKLYGNLKNKKVRAVLVLDQRTTQVKRGENRDRTLTNSNIVVSEKYISTKDTEGFAYLGVPEIVKPKEKVHLMLFLENDDLEITGAAKKTVSR